MNIICMTVGMVLFIGFLIAIVEGGDKYKKNIAELDKDRYSFPEIYTVGYAILDLIKFNTKSERNTAKINKLYELHGDRKKAEKHLRAVRAGQISYVLTFVPIGCGIAAVVNQAVIMVLGLVLVFLLVYDLEKQIDSALSERKEALLQSFPTAVSKLTLLVNSGAILNEAWEKTAYGGEGELYDEMRQVIVDRENGYTSVESYTRFAKRCGVKEIDKFTAIMIQNMDKGSSELVEYLRDITNEMWKSKKHNSKILTDRLNNKLMIPTFLIFAGILILVMAPMFISMMGAF